MSFDGCPACQVLQFYMDRDSFLSAIECVVCHAIIDNKKSQQPEQTENPELDDLPPLEPLPSLEELPGIVKETPKGQMLMCDNNWCSFNIMIKEGDKVKASRAQSLLKTHMEKCAIHKKNGRRFKRVVSRNGKEQGQYVDIEKHGLGFQVTKSENTL